MSSTPFIFVVCQVGAETALKNEVAKKHPSIRFAFSRPGFVTFRVTDEIARDRKFELRCTFARTWGHSLGKLIGSDGNLLAADLWKAIADRYPADVLRQFKHLHVWERDREVPGDRDFEPGITPLAEEVGELLMQHKPDLGSQWELNVNQDAQPDDRVLDCVLVEPGEWWFGWHRVHTMEGRWPGGVPDLNPPENMVSRTYLKMAEALLWSQLPIKFTDECVEIGSAPGGSCQALLETGMSVTGVDPAEMDPILMAHPLFRHRKARAKDLKRSEFAECRWLVSDASVAPNYTLDTVEAIVSHPDVSIEGLLLTLKLTEWELAAEIPAFNKRIRSWGFDVVRSRQLAFNRCEICVFAMTSDVLKNKRPALPADTRIVSAEELRQLMLGGEMIEEVDEPQRKSKSKPGKVESLEETENDLFQEFEGDDDEDDEDE